MTKKDAIKVFEDKKIRAVWDDQKEEWYFSIVDVVSVLTESVDGRKYWNKLKTRRTSDISSTATCLKLLIRCAARSALLRIS